MYCVLAFGEGRGFECRPHLYHLFVNIRNMQQHKHNTHSTCIRGTEYPSLTEVPSTHHTKFEILLHSA